MAYNKFIIFLFVILVNQSMAAKRIKDQNSRSENNNSNQIITGSCQDLKCGPGRVCNIDRTTRQAKCYCVPDCTAVVDPRRKVCSNFNDTWQSDCHLHRHRCLCEEGLSEHCIEDHKHMHIDYFGECTDSLKCEESVLIDFPRRMREWLYNILTSEHFDVPKNLTDDHDLAHKWVDAVLWKFCDLDVEPEDRFVSRHELFPLRAPLLSMEPCIAEFLDKCDSNQDHKITLKEWGLCLGAESNEIEDRCTIFKSIIHRDHSLTP